MLPPVTGYVRYPVPLQYTETMEPSFAGLGRGQPSGASLNPGAAVTNKELDIPTTKAANQI